MVANESLEPADLPRLLRRISHDLRTPLGSISIWLHLFRTSGDAAERDLALVRIEEALQAAARLASDLSGCAALLEPGSERRRTEVDLGGLVREAFASLRARATPPDVTLDLQTIVNGDDVRVEADHELLARALEELLAHAAQHASPGGRLEVRIEADADSARLVVPLGAAAWSEICPLRESIHAAAGTKAAAASLALSLAREIVGMHGGALSHRDSPPDGTLVIRLPRRGA